MPNIYENLLEAARHSNQRFETVKNEETDADYFARLAQAVSGTTRENFNAMPPEAQSWFDRAADALNASQPVPMPEGYDRNTALAQHPQPQAHPTAPQPIGRPTALTMPPSQGPSTPVAAAQPAHLPGPASSAAFETDAPRAPTPPEQQHAAAQPDQHPSPDAQAQEEERPRRRRRNPPKEKPARMHTGPRGQAVHEGMSITTLIRRLVVKDYPGNEVEVDDILAKLKQQGSDLSERRSTVATLRYDTISMLKLALESGWQPPEHQQRHAAQ
jgi:hypothetical protein